MKSIIPYWQTILGIFFLFQKEENLSDEDGFTKPSLDQMEKWIDINLVLLLKDFHKFKAFDYTETFSPVAKMNSIHLVLSFVASFKWEVH